MTEMPIDDPRWAPSAPDGVQVPGPEDEPMRAPRDEPVPDRGEGLDIDIPDSGDVPGMGAE